MNEDLRNDELLRSYLLGKLPEEGAERLEARLIEEDELFDLCEAVEADLLAAYDRGELTGWEKERVRRLASSPAGQERLALARALNSAARRPERTAAPVVPLRRRAFPIPQPLIRWTALAAAVLLVAIGAFWIPQSLKRSGPIEAGTKILTPAKRTGKDAPKRPGTLAIQVPKDRQPRTESDRPPQRDERAAKPLERRQPFVVALSLAALRSAEGTENVRIPSDEELIEFQIDLEGLEGESFHAAVRSKEGGTTVWESHGLGPKRLDWGTALILRIPAHLLPSGSYEVVVTAESDKYIKDLEVVRETR